MAYRIAPVPFERLLDARPHSFDHAADHPGQYEVRHVHQVLDAVLVQQFREFASKSLRNSSRHDAL